MPYIILPSWLDVKIPELTLDKKKNSTINRQWLKYDMITIMQLLLILIITFLVTATAITTRHKLWKGCERDEIGNSANSHNRQHSTKNVSTIIVFIVIPRTRWKVGIKIKEGLKKERQSGRRKSIQLVSSCILTSTAQGNLGTNHAFIFYYIPV